MLLHVLKFCFITWLNSISCYGYYTLLVIHFSEGWTLACFYHLADMNNDTTNILSIPFKTALIAKYQFFPTLQPHIIQGHFTDFFFTSSHCLNSALFSALCLFIYLFIFTTLKTTGIESMVALYFLNFMVIGFVKAVISKYLLLCIFHCQMKNREKWKG